MSLSLRAYSRQRGTSVEAVRRAIKSGRLKSCLVTTDAGRVQIGDADLADREWAANTDLTKAPSYVKERAAGRLRGPVTGPQAVTPPVTEPSVTPEGPGDSLSAAAAREKFWKAKTAELDYREHAGQLVDKAQANAWIVDAFALVRSALLAVPSKAKATLPHLTHADVLVLDGLVRQALEGLAARAKLPPSQSEDAA